MLVDYTFSFCGFIPFFLFLFLHLQSATTQLAARTPPLAASP
jgi:hypothetical protein